ncbi:MAG: CotH kinase family protein, partial [Bacteroidota bacterium]
MSPKAYLLLFLFSAVSGLFAQSFDGSSHLPLLIVQSNGEAIVDDPRIAAEMCLIYNGTQKRNRIGDPCNQYEGQISIEIRGSSSQFFPKKGYGFETQNADSSNNNVVLLGMPSENDWILHGPFSDKSLIRNALTYRIGRDIGRYA